MGFIVFLNTKSFNPTQSEYILISMVCLYCIISGIHDLAPYIDETADRIIQQVIMLINTQLNKKK